MNQFFTKLSFCTIVTMLIFNCMIMRTMDEATKSSETKAQPSIIDQVMHTVQKLSDWRSPRPLETITQQQINSMPINDLANITEEDLSKQQRRWVRTRIHRLSANDVDVLPPNVFVKLADRLTPKQFPRGNIAQMLMLSEKDIRKMHPSTFAGIGNYLMPYQLAWATQEQLEQLTAKDLRSMVKLQFEALNIQHIKPQVLQKYFSDPHIPYTLSDPQQAAKLTKEQARVLVNDPRTHVHFSFKIFKIIQNRAEIPAGIQFKQKTKYNTQKNATKMIDAESRAPLLLSQLSDI